MTFMGEHADFQVLANLVLALHLAVVAFVVLGLVFVVLGNVRWRWRWVNNPWLRGAHLAAIAFIVLETCFGVVCPLTTLEMALRAKAQAPVYGGDFVAHWLQRLLYYDAPPWVFLLGYVLFALMVAAAWWYFPPRRSRA
jgi:hypothetical protein